MLKKLWQNAKRRTLPYIIAYTAKYGMRLLLRTCRLEVQGLEQFTAIASDSACILMLWHNRLAVIPEVMHRFAAQFMFTAFISKSRDGHALALLTQSYKIGQVLRVPHNARHHALSQMIQQLKARREVVIVTPDGPRGPRYVVKPGIAMAAREAGVKVIPFSWEADRAWSLKTWDKMMIPKPFSRLKITFGDALLFPKETAKDSAKDLQQETELLRDALEALQTQ